MLMMLLATIAWGWLYFSAMPEVLAGNFGPWDTSTQAWYFGIVVLMVICTLAATFGVRRGRPARTEQQ